MPADYLARLPDSELRLALLHELAHVRRGDLPPIDVDVTARIAKVVRPKAEWLTRRSVVQAIGAQGSNME